MSYGYFWRDDACGVNQFAGTDCDPARIFARSVTWQLILIVAVAIAFGLYCAVTRRRWAQPNALILAALLVILIITVITNAMAQVGLAALGLAGVVFALMSLVYYAIFAAFIFWGAGRYMALTDGRATLFP